MLCGQMIGQFRWDHSTMIKAITFDLGDTLIYYDGVALNWSSHYARALTVGFAKSGVGHQAQRIGECEEVLRKFNTRINPRDKEYSAAEIFRQIGAAVGANESQQIVIMDEFFAYFQQKIKIYSDTFGSLTKIKASGLATGILTDVAYGMPKANVQRDVAEIGDLIDVLLTSVEVGFRKPSTIGYTKIADALEIGVHQMIYVGNEEKDIVGANRAGVAASILINRSGKDLDYGQSMTFPNLDEMTMALRSTGVLINQE